MMVKVLNMDKVKTFFFQLQIISVHGIRFSYEKLQDKVSERFPRNNRTGKLSTVQCSISSLVFSS
jgi:hypothetical protein